MEQSRSHACVDAGSMLPSWQKDVYAQSDAFMVAFAIMTGYSKRFLQDSCAIKTIMIKTLIFSLQFKGCGNLGAGAVKSK